MLGFVTKISKKIANLKLESKFMLATVCINTFFILVFLFVGISVVTSRYDELLYQSMQSSSALVSNEFSNRLNNLVTLSNIVRADTAVQDGLDGVLHPDTVTTGYRIHAYSEIYGAIQQHYEEYEENYTTYAAIYCPRFVAHTYGYTTNKPDEVKQAGLVEFAEAGDGSPVWVTRYVEDDGLYLVRQIKKIANLKLDNLGTFILRVDLNRLVEEVSKVSKEFEGSHWILYEENDIIYASDELTDQDLKQIRKEIRDYGVITIAGKKYFAINGTIKSGWDYFHLVSYDEVARSISVTQAIYIVILIGGILLSFVVMHIVIRKVVRHIELLIKRMKDFGSNSDELPQVSYDYSTRMDEIGMLHRQFDSMAEQIQTLVVENYRQQILMKDAQLKSLESQMNPHFLYNTLDSVNWRAKAIGEKQISQIAESLGHFLRMTLNKKSDNFSLREEMEIIQCYMTIQQLRFDNRLNYQMNVPEIYRDAMIPKLSIQPLLENAVHYALEQITDDCSIWFTCTRVDSKLQIYVKNTGSEFEEDLLRKLRNHEIKEKGLGIALLNIEERIRLMFGEEYGLEFYNEGEYAVVKMEIPYVPIEKG